MGLSKAGEDQPQFFQSENGGEAHSGTTGPLPQGSPFPGTPLVAVAATALVAEIGVDRLLFPL